MPKKTTTIGELKGKRKLSITKERNWEFDSVARGNNSIAYFGDSSDRQNPFLSSIENIKEKCWLNFKLCNNTHKYFINKLNPNKPYTDNKKVKIKYTDNKHIWVECISGVNIEYQIFDGKLKENIILKNTKAPFIFSFSVKTSEGLEIKKNLDGGIDVFKEDKKVFDIERPVARDKKGRIFYYNFIIKEEGKFYILTLEPVDVTQLMYASYPIIIDPTTTIITDANVAITSIYSDSKVCFTTPKGSTMAVYTNNDDIYLAESTDSCQNFEVWDTGLNMRTPSYTSGYSADVDSNGIIHIVYPSSSSPPYIMHASSADIFETSTTISTNDFSYAAAIAIDSNDKLNVARYEATGIYYDYSTDGGLNWTSSEIADGDVRYHPAIAVDSTDTICIVWEYFKASGTFSKNIFRALSSNSWAVETVTTETTEGYYQEHPAVGFDQDDNDIVFWSGKIDAAEYRIRYKLVTGTDTVYNYTDGTDESKMPSVGFDSTGGKLFVAWSELAEPGVYDIKRASYETASSFTNLSDLTYFSDVHLAPSLTRQTGTTNDPILFMQADTLSAYTNDTFNSPWNLADTIVSDTITIGIFDTKDPIVLSAIAISSTPTSTDTASTLTVSWTEANPDTSEFAVRIGAESWTSTSGTGNTTTPGATRCLFYTAVDGNDFINMRCVHIDDYGHTITSSDTVYIKPTAPDVPVLSSVTDSTMAVVVNNNATDSAAIAPSVFDHAISISGGATDSWVQTDGTLGNTEAWNTVGEWGTKTITTLTKSTNYTVYSKVRNPTDNITESAIGTTAQLATKSLPPVITNTGVTVPTTGTERYTITYDVSDADDTFLIATLFYYDSSAYVTLTTLQGDFSNIDVTTTAATKTAIWSAGTDADDVSLQTSHIKVTVNDGDTSVSDTSANFILDTKDPDFTAGTTLTLSGVQDTQITATWNNTVTETNFSTYVLYYSSASLAEAKAKGGTEWDKVDDATLGTKATVTTDITGLTANVTYYFALFAKDTQGNFSSDDINTSDTTEYSRRIYGYVLDDKDNYIPDANVRRYTRSTGALLDSTTTDTWGYYNIAFYGSVGYMVVAHKNNYSSDVLNTVSGTIVGNSVTEDYNLTLNGNQSKRRPIDKADIWVGRGDSIIDMNKSVAHERINVDYSHEQINEDYSHEQINMDYDHEQIDKTIDVD